MIDFLKANSKLSLYLSVTLLFFIRKGIQYFMIGSYFPLLIIVSLIILLAVSLKVKVIVFVFFVRIWSIILIVWALIRILISIVNNTIKPFDGSWHLAQQFNIYSLLLSIVILWISVMMYRSLNKKRLNY